MPIYEYQCQKCNAKFEERFTLQQSPNYMLACPVCKLGNGKRIFSPPVIHQTGYKQTDARYNRGKG